MSYLNDGSTIRGLQITHFTTGLKGRLISACDFFLYGLVEDSYVHPLPKTEQLNIKRCDLLPLRSATTTSTESRGGTKAVIDANCIIQIIWRKEAKGIFRKSVLYWKKRDVNRTRNKLLAQKNGELGQSGCVQAEKESLLLLLPCMPALSWTLPCTDNPLLLEHKQYLAITFLIFRHGHFSPLFLSTNILPPLEIETQKKSEYSISSSEIVGIHVSTFPSQEVNFRNAARKFSVVRLVTSSKWTALVTKHTKNVTYSLVGIPFRFDGSVHCHNGLFQCEEIVLVTQMLQNWAMEQEILIEGFKRSDSMHGLRFTYVIGDGDSSMYIWLVQNVSYGRSIHKVVCANHCVKNYMRQLQILAVNILFAIEGHFTTLLQRHGRYFEDTLSLLEANFTMKKHQFWHWQGRCLENGQRVRKKFPEGHNRFIKVSKQIILLNTTNILDADDLNLVPMTNDPEPPIEILTLRGEHQFGRTLSSYHEDVEIRRLAFQFTWSYNPWSQYPSVSENGQYEEYFSHDKALRYWSHAVFARRYIERTYRDLQGFIYWVSVSVAGNTSECIVGYRLDSDAKKAEDAENAAYMFTEDPNELADRLKILIATQRAVAANALLRELFNIQNGCSRVVGHTLFSAGAKLATMYSFMCARCNTICSSLNCNMVHVLVELRQACWNKITEQIEIKLRQQETKLTAQLQQHVRKQHDQQNALQEYFSMQCNLLNQTGTNQIKQVQGEAKRVNQTLESTATMLREQIANNRNKIVAQLDNFALHLEQRFTRVEKAVQVEKDTTASYMNQVAEQVKLSEHQMSDIVISLGNEGIDYTMNFTQQSTRMPARAIFHGVKDKENISASWEAVMPQGEVKETSSVLRARGSQRSDERVTKQASSAPIQRVQESSIVTKSSGTSW
ncbi:hypothetical protein PR048_001701 [Dryococelus australis]|uniref:Mutator-like transposase domain-containing protein n=1 Tax=Dryococelus australis TaxID=614101 RepID=A0ABQ9II22_9NEOP|nr:hypothetical protein PR048_001701 [Dryococelus australis]